MASTTQMNSDIEGTAKRAAHTVSDAAADVAEKAGRHMERAFGSAETAVRSIAEQGKEAGDRVQQVAGNIKGAVEKSVTDQPMATLAIAVGLGFVIGALWKS